MALKCSLASWGAWPSLGGLRGALRRLALSLPGSVGRKVEREYGCPPNSCGPLALPGSGVHISEKEKTPTCLLAGLGSHSVCPLNTQGTPAAPPG